LGITDFWFRDYFEYLIRKSSPALPGKDAGAIFAPSIIVGKVFVLYDGQLGSPLALGLPVAAKLTQ
jgi:hypothetical protein